ncbi:MAG TPA: xanthine dehydrogenase family protein molybdopterin-binding subunit [Solirubrobacteraceae bacterium]|nr:xanthine dehydrogenase family protein molybdopterin-binding subunit [Solirubrobacteraceae bacterium]
MSFVPYVDAHARVTGQIEYVLDMTVPHMLHAAVTRCDVPHGHLRRVDTSAALAVPGVVAALTGADLEHVGIANPYFGSIFKDQPVLAIDRVRFVGEPVAAIAAVDAETARHAASLVEVEIEEIDAVFDVAKAIGEGAPPLHDEMRPAPGFADVSLQSDPGRNLVNRFVIECGDLDAGFAKAEFVFEDTFRTGGTQHVPMETHVTIADARRGHDAQIWAATQGPYILRAELASVLGLPESRVRVMVPTLGGGYGAKTYPKLEPLVAVLSRHADAPVKLVLDRYEEFLTTKNHESLITIRTGVAADGSLVAREVNSYWDAGAYADISPRFIRMGGCYGPGPYRIPNVRIRSHAVYTNKPPSTAFRGFSNPQAAHAYECQLDMIADRLGRDPVDLRLANLLRSGDRFATGEVMEEMNLRELVSDAAQQIDLSMPAPTRPEDPPQLRRGRGLGVVIMMTITPSSSSATVKVNGDGSVNVLSSTVEMGQGSRTALAQMVAERMRVPLERVRLVDPDTDVTPYDLITAASRSTFMMGGALLSASDDAIAQLRQLAQDELEVSAEDLELRDGGFYVVGTDRGSSFGKLVTGSLVGTVVGRGTHTTEGGLEPTKGQGIASAQWHQCAAAAEVAVDVETGHVTVERLHLGTFTGKTINKTNAELQLEGAAIFGLGEALYEELEYDGGHIMNANLASYLVPTFKDVPAEFTTTLLESSDPDAEVHGIGENGMGPIPAAVTNAIHRAVGVWMRELPITSEKVLRALHEREVE